MPTSLTNLYRPATGATLLEPLPTFAVMNAYSGNSGYAYVVLDSYWNPVLSSQPQSSENFSGLASYLNTSGSISSNSLGSYFAQATCFNQAEGNWIWNPPSRAAGGYDNLIRPVGNFINSYWPYYGTVIGTAGKRQRISTYIQNNTIQIHKRGGSGIIASFSISNASLINLTGEPASTSYGQISYNERTKTLAIMRGNGSAQYRLHVWKNPNINLNDDALTAGELYTFMYNARQGIGGASYFYNDFTWNTSGSTSYSESMYHNRVIMGDNGMVGLVRMTPSNQTVHAYVVPNTAGTSPTSGPTTVSSLSLTTSYGIDQGNYYGMRSNITWDNSFVFCYSPYYYYGSGLNMHHVSTENPSIGYTNQDSNTSWGVQVMPIGTSEVLTHNTSTNADSANGILMYIVSPQAAYKNGVQLNSDTSVSSGSPLNLFGYYCPVDTGYTSTNYPHVVPMGTWAQGDR